LFAEAEPVEDERVEPAAREPPTHPEIPNDTGVGPAPRETVALWMNLVATMGPDELADFEERAFRTWDRASLSALRIVIDRRRRELTPEPLSPQAMTTTAQPVRPRLPASTRGPIRREFDDLR
jgi:hypothetical protein